ncbi:hypothetical protein [Mesorhizobium sp. ESP-6-2]|uniref:hypothetical protein n=1 Tax=Mesorhizobium sp. ESP-6-2 TaxID=2876625 RepID=UPI001CCC9082|nr:hypothetical protein [Mesorhizobium sp. ESP-6-2]MBZ9808315.1 hypothetical protein [Mesorhizobium sp. ESP-6-2]
MIYNGNSPWLDRSLRLSLSFESFLHPIAERIAKEGGKRRREHAVDNIKTALSVILANLLRSYALQPSLGIKIDLSNDAFPRGPFNPLGLGIRAIRKVVDFLARSSLPLIHRRGGNFDKQRAVGYPTELRISEILLDEVMKFIKDNVKEVRYQEPCNQSITRNTFSIDFYTSNFESIFQKESLPIIRLRKGSSRKDSGFADFEPTPETDQMESRLRRYNSFLQAQARINLFLTDDEIDELGKRKEQDQDELGSFQSDSRLIDLPSANRLYRIFNDGSFDHGGRFYGGWWQNVPKEYRRFITINGMPTVEVDFSSMQLAMLYAKVGEQLEGDAYAIDGLPSELRPLVKATTLAIINAPGRIRAPSKSALPEGISWKDLQQAILEKHRPIAEYFRSGEGIRLQRLDSDIAEDVILGMMERGIPVLPIHDSFIVPEGLADEMSATMLDAYQQRMRGMTISLTRSTSLLDELLADQGGLGGDERHNLGMKLFLEMKEMPEYEGYRLREKLLGDAKIGSSGQNTKITWVDLLGGGLRETGPRAQAAYSGSEGLPRERNNCGTAL